MRITCPNCTASFEIPTELLGKKGRSLKCASCGHSWYQTPHVETIDLAEIMGQEYAARAKADMGPRSSATPPPARPGAAPVAAPPAAPGAPPRPLQMAAAAATPAAAPLGVSMLRKGPPAGGPPPGQTAQSWNVRGQPAIPGAAPNAGPGAPAAAVAGAAGAAASWYQPERPQKMAPPPPGAPSWYQPEQAPTMGPKQGPAGAPSWYQPDPALQRPSGPPQVLQHQPDALPRLGGGVLAGPQAAALGGQSMRGQAGAGAVGDGSQSWMQPVNQPGGIMPAGGPGMMPPPGQGPMAGAMRGQTMMGQAGAGAVGDQALSWTQPQRGPMPPPGAMGGAPGASLMGQAGAGAVGDAAVSWNQRGPIPPQGMPGAPGASLMGQAGAGAVGDAAISWNQRGAAPPGAVGGPMGQSLMGQAGAAAVGDASVSWVQQPGVVQAGAPGAPGVSQMGVGIQAPGQGAHSLLDGTQRAPGQAGQSVAGQNQQGPGAAAVSQMTGAVQAPGMPSQSMLSGAVQTPGQPGQSALQPAVAGVGAPGASQLGQPGVPGAPGVSQMGQPGAPGAPGTSQMGQAAAPGQAGVSMAQAGAPGTAAAAAAQAGTSAAAATTAAEAKTKADPKLVAMEQVKNDVAAALVQGETKAKDEKAAEKGAAGEAVAPLWSGAKEDEELVDPDADRPDFGTTEEAAAAEEDEEEAADDDEPVPGLTTAMLRPERSRVDPAYITAGLMIVAVACIGMLLWLERGPLAKMWPGFDAIYEKLGLESKRPGEGLRLTQSGMRLLRIGGIETLVIKGYVSNIGDKERPVPHIRLQLLDATGEVVQQSDTSPTLSTLPAGASMDFVVKLELPNMAAAKNVVVNWAD